MKKKIASAAIVAAIAITAGWNAYQNSQEVELNELALANVEALASGEGPGIDQSGKKFVNDCCKTYQPREFKCSDVWPDC